MRFDYILIGFIIFAVFMVGSVMMMTDMQNSYVDVTNSTIDDKDMNDIITQSNQTLEDIDLMTQSIQNKTLEGDTSTATSWDSLIQGSYSSVRLITGSFKMLNNVLSAVASKLHIPSFVVSALFAIFIIALIFSIIYMVFRFRP